MEIVPGVHVVRLIGSRAHLVVDGSSLTLIDAGHRGSGTLLRRYLDGIDRRIGDVSRIVCTHGHPDHIGGVREIASASGAEVLLHEADAHRLRISLREVIAHPAPGPVVALLTRALEDPKPLADGQILPGGIEVLHTPGHTPGSICLYLRERRLIFTGDLLQVIDGRLALPHPFFSDDLELARRSIARLAELDVETIAFAHFPPLREGAREALRDLAA